MKKVQKELILTLFLVGILLLVGCTQTELREKASDVPIKPKVDFKAPDFTLTDLNGKKVKLSDFKGQVVFLNFWATWCPPCRAEMPHIQEIHQEKGNKVKVLAVNVKESPKKVKEFMEKNGYNFTVLMDKTGEVANDYLVRGIPKTLIINQERVITTEHVGSMNKTKMNNLLTEAF
ncbi:TlpA family protein disulfide reductase [Acetohalobium arabaticum]|uniref:Alkyl hydroperoxide reductase/ Thiol specific antioxidant/ Mal allergen n=1 Tax=Acetohalobium arabaticum (strain ATCC 49924 / DSM 5501 / Z-7288) TaxID=574087 RepID=D9QSA5_ACEAZ|nr:TlpA disulfide reductase family protein [Acetohalobium arabaticum]ADL11561.1 alkyl hydroperoxide reductase/ Thiol specific antioxidant/ Mal allergen [Acetohalobium arabaticum DSM 5501]